MRTAGTGPRGGSSCAAAGPRPAAGAGGAAAAAAATAAQRAGARAPLPGNGGAGLCPGAPLAGGGRGTTAGGRGLAEPRAGGATAGAAGPAAELRGHVEQPATAAGAAPRRPPCPRSGRVLFSERGGGAYGAGPAAEPSADTECSREPFSVFLPERLQALMEETDSRGLLPGSCRGPQLRAAERHREKSGTRASPG